MKHSYQSILKLESFILRLLQKAIPFFYWLFFLSAIYYLYIFILLSISQLRYSHYLYWYEDLALDMIVRIRNGQPIYTAPTEAYIPIVYPPFYYYLSALLSYITGTNFFTIRLISFIASIGTLMLIFKFVQQETKDFKSAIIACGLYAASFSYTEGIMAMGRIDALHNFFLLLFFYLVRYTKSWKMQALAGIIASAAYFTKQTTIVVIAVLVIYYFYFNRRHLITFIATFFVVTTVSFIILQMTSHGWYSYYTLFLPSRHSLSIQNIFYFLTRDLFYFKGSFLILTILYLFSKKNIFFIYMAIALLGISFIGRANTGAGVNVVLSAYMIIALCSGLALHTIFKQSSKPIHLFSLCINLFILFMAFSQMQFAYLPYNSTLITMKDTQHIEDLVRSLKSIKGDVYIPSHIYFLHLANKPIHAHMHSLLELTGYWGNGSPTPEGKTLEKKLIDKFTKKYFKAIVLDETEVKKGAEKTYINPYKLLIEKYYTPVKKFPIRMRLTDRQLTLYIPKAH